MCHFSFPFIAYRPCLQAFFHVCLDLPVLFALSICLHFSSSTPFRNLTKRSSFWGTMANTAKVWRPASDGQHDHQKRYLDKHCGRSSIWPIWLKHMCRFTACRLSAARPTVHVSEKLLRQLITSEISYNILAFQKKKQTKKDVNKIWSFLQNIFFGGRGGVGGVEKGGSIWKYFKKTSVLRYGLSHSYQWTSNQTTIWYSNKCRECCEPLEMLCFKLENTFQANLIKIDTFL